MNGERVLRFFAAHPTAANLLMAVFLFLGLMSVGDLRRETLPDFTPHEVEIKVVYPGASAREVEEAVCRRIEDALDGITDVAEVRVEAREGLGRVVAEMEDGGHLDRFISDVKTEVEAIDDFPEEVERPVIRLMNRTDNVVSVAVSGPMSVPDLKLYCEQLKDRLLRLPQISQVNVLGFSEHQIRIEVPAATLMQFGLSASDLARSVAAMSVDLPAGTVETRDADVLLRFKDQRAAPADFQDLVVFSEKDGAEVRLGQIAAVTDRFELDEEKILFNGKRAGMLEILKTKRQDALEVMDAVEAFLERERGTAPPGVAFALTRNVSEIVRDRLDLLTVNGLQGLVLVFLAMWAFFSLRFSFWVAMGLPVAFLGGLWAMSAIGFSLNMITMVGLLLATGLIMDDAIVISENVQARLALGEKPLDAAVRGTARVAAGVVSSFLTTLLIFGSLAVFIAGDIGKVLWVMPVVLILTLSVSLVEAFLILPCHMAHSMRQGPKAPGRFRKRFESGVEFARDAILGRAVDAVVSRRYLFIGLVMAVLALSIGMIAGGRLKTTAFPELDGDVLEARILLPQGTPLARTEEVADRVAQALYRVNATLSPLQPDGRSLVENVFLRFNQNADAYETGPHVATVGVDLLGAEERDARILDITNLWRKEVGEVPDVIAINFKEPAIGPGGLAIDIRLEGPDLDRLKAASGELADWLRRYRGVLDLSDDLRPGKPEIRVSMRPGARALGVTASEVADQVRSAFYGRTADEIQVGGESYEIDVRVDKGDRDHMGDLAYFHVTGPGGRQIPLTELAELAPGRGWARVQRIDSVRTVTIRGDVDTDVANADEIVADTAERFLPEMKRRWPDISFTLKGQAEEGAKTGASMRKALLVGVFGVFVLLSFQFRSYVEPLAVLSAIPLALIGVVWGHVFMGLELSMPSVMGFVSLAGVVVNDSILLIQFIKTRAREGMNVPDAAKAAGRDRFRAVLMTSLTTIMGLMPLLMEKSLQAQILVPLATSIVFGLTASTMLILLVVPSLYAILDDFGLTSLARERNNGE